jgi:hypothetical protein
MPVLANCPKCFEPVSRIPAEPVTIGDRMTGPQFQAVVARCPHCKTILGVLNEPDSRIDAIVRELGQILSILKKKTGLSSM